MISIGSGGSQGLSAGDSPTLLETIAPSGDDGVMERVRNQVAIWGVVAALLGTPSPLQAQGVPQEAPQEAPQETPLKNPEEAPPGQGSATASPEEVETENTAVPEAGPSDGDGSRAHYTIEAKVDVPTRMLEGTLTLRWRNGTDVPAQDLWFHLHHNAYANNRSMHLTEANGRLRGLRVTDGWGWQRVTRVTHGEEDWTERLRIEPPDLEGVSELYKAHGDRTIFSIPLTEPVAPGEELEIELAWESLIPRVRRRTGIKDDFLFMSHWFPKLGVFEGTRGWNCHRFHMNTEFYADFGEYDVTLNLPQEYAEGPDENGQWAAKIGASGGLAEPVRVEQGRVIARYLAPTSSDRTRPDPITRTKPLVHGFAWTADPDYRVHTRTFRYDEWAQRYHTEVQAAAIAFRHDVEAIRLRDVDIHVLIQPERESQWERHYEATAAALFFYGIWWGEYPYETLTVVDPAWGASAAGGMEYPTIFTAGTSRHTARQMYRPESVTVHEAGHQFWYGLVANNEYEAAWLDEGLNSYTDSEVLWRHYGPRRDSTRYSSLPVWGRTPGPLPSSAGWLGPLTGQRWALPNPGGWKWLEGMTLRPAAVSPFVAWYRDQPLLTFVEQYTDPRWGDRSGYLRDPDVDPIETKAFAYRDRSSYRTNSYPRPAVALRSLVGVVGRDAFLRGMRQYADAWRYKHPYPEDFYREFQVGAETDVQWYFDEVFRGTGTVDWNVRVIDRGAWKDEGFFLGEDGVWRDAAHSEESVEPAPASDEVEQPDGETKQEVPGVEPEAPLRRQEVVVSRKGTLRIPLPILVRFADGSEQRFTWTREAQEGSKWWRLPLPDSSEAIQAVLLDPERLIYLDQNMFDNQWYAETSSSRGFRWSERAFTQYQHLLHFLSNLGG